jgi:hypothetical protein
MKYYPEVGYQLVKCGLNNEIKVVFEPCENFVSSLITLPNGKKVHRHIPVLTPEIKTLADCW